MSYVLYYLLLFIVPVIELSESQIVSPKGIFELERFTSVKDEINKLITCAT